MWTHRRFTWRYRPDDPLEAARLAPQVLVVLERLFMDTPQFYRDGAVRGMALGVLEFEVTISDRDRWWVDQKARFLIDAIRKGTDVPLDLVSEEKAKLPVHMNRGKWHLRRQARRARENHG